MKPVKFVIVFLSAIPCLSQIPSNYPGIEEGPCADMLTPEYYNSPENSRFRQEVNRFVYFARSISFRHPLQDSAGNIPPCERGRGFGDGIGPGGAGSHHPAVDLYLKEPGDQHNLYAACDGYLKVDRSIRRYRHSLSITTDVTDSAGNVLGKMRVIYAHIDLDLDSADHILPDGKYVHQGDLVSGNLYSGTRGGPHLHFEIRYYRPTDDGDEDFYGGQTGNKTFPSAGPWTHGYWNPDTGYGFAHPFNHLVQTDAGISEQTGEIPSR